MFENVKKLFWIIAFSITIFTSCTFKPYDESFTNVNPPVEPDGSITIPFEKDTVYITGNTHVDFRFISSDHKIYKLTFDIGDYNIYSSNGESSIDGSFYFSYDFIEEGTYPLKMTSVVSSNSGSLADKTGHEGYELTKTWTVIYKKYPIKPKVTFAGPVDGRLKIVWGKSNSISFQEYTIKEGMYNYDIDRYYFKDIKTLTDASEAFFIDSNFVGGTVKYIITTKEGDFTSSSDTLTYNAKNMGFYIQNDNSLNRIYSWDKTEFYNNFGRIEIKYVNLEDINSQFSLKTLVTIDNPSDTSYSIKDGLIFDRRYYFYMIPKDEVNYFFNYDYLRLIKDHYSIGDTFCQSNQLCFAAVSPYNIYGKNANTLFKYSTSNGEFTSKALTSKFGMAASLNDNYLISGEYLINTLTLESQNIDIQKEMGFWEFFTTLSISDNGIFVGETRYYYDKVAYDLENIKPVQVIKVPYQSLHIPKVSPNGQYIVMTADYNSRIEIWKFNADSNKYIMLCRKYGNYNENTHISFLQTNSESKFYIANGNYIELWSCEQTQALQSYLTEATDILQIDPVTKNVIAYKAGHFLIYDPNDFSLQWDVVLDPGYIDYWNTWHPEQYVVVNSVVYTNSKKLDLKNYEKVH
jgi:hypothetical protein